MPTHPLEAGGAVGVVVGGWNARSLFSRYKQWPFLPLPHPDVPEQPQPPASRLSVDGVIRLLLVILVYPAHIYTYCTLAGRTGGQVTCSMTSSARSGSPQSHIAET